MVSPEATVWVDSAAAGVDLDGAPVVARGVVGLPSVGGVVGTPPLPAIVLGVGELGVGAVAPPVPTGAVRGVTGASKPLLKPPPATRVGEADGEGVEPGAVIGAWV